MVVVGFIDDRWGLGAISKLAGQVAAAGILVWSGQSLPWLPRPSGGVFSLEPDLSLTLTILLVVVTINAINFIDGLDGLAAGIVGRRRAVVPGVLLHAHQTIGNTSQSLPAVSSALLAGMCLGFLPHNFYPARIFMGDIGAMLLGLMLAYGPISTTASLDPALLTNYGQTHTLDRFPTFLPLLVPVAILVIPYTDMMFAVIRRTRAGKPPMAADRQHLHHRVLNIGHSYRQSVLIMYLWAALFSVTVVSLSVVRPAWSCSSRDPGRGPHPAARHHARGCVPGGCWPGAVPPRPAPRGGRRPRPGRRPAAAPRRRRRRPAPPLAARRPPGARRAAAPLPRRAARAPVPERVGGAAAPAPARRRSPPRPVPRGRPVRPATSCPGAGRLPRATPDPLRADPPRRTPRSPVTAPPGPAFPSRTPACAEPRPGRAPSREPPHPDVHPR